MTWSTIEDCMIKKIYNITKAENIIIVNKNVLSLYKSKYNFKKIIKTKAFVGENGIGVNKKEGDLKTPRGLFKIGLAFGSHKMELDKSMKYVIIDENLYWVDDTESIYYNKLVDAREVNKDWKSAEHLISYPKQYEYALEIKTNTANIKGKGSAIFLHCSVGMPTSGCVAIETKEMKKLLENINSNTVILIK